MCYNVFYAPLSGNIYSALQIKIIMSTHSYCFSHQGIDGRLFLQLTKEQIANLTGMKVGPSLKIHDLIQALKVKAGLGSESTFTSHDITAVTEAVKSS